MEGFQICEKNTTKEDISESREKIKIQCVSTVCLFLNKAEVSYQICCVKCMG